MEENNYNEIIESDKDPSHLNNLISYRLMKRLNHPRFKRLSTDIIKKVKKRPLTSFTAIKPVPPGYKATRPVIRIVN